MTRRSIALAFAVLLSAHEAAAQPAPEPYVVKFNEGRKLLTDNKYAEALEKIQESLALKEASGTLLNLGDCQEHLGQYASALVAFERARSLAADEKKAERESEAAELARKLEPLTSKITCSRAGHAEDHGRRAGPRRLVSRSRSTGAPTSCTRRRRANGAETSRSPLG